MSKLEIIEKEIRALPRDKAEELQGWLVRYLNGLTNVSGQSQSLPPLKMRNFNRPKVVTPNFSRAEIAEELFRRE